MNADEHADQHEDANRDVQAVEPGQAVKDGAVDARGDRKPSLTIRVVYS